MAMDELNSERIITPMPKSLVQAIDDFRFSERMPSRAEAIRRLILLGLDAVHQEQMKNQPPL
ncbi:hypothetical protein HNH97_09700 [Gluconacetobacter entanii]|nr:hypothetical protein [Gluconacetobacter entanii]